MYTYTCSIINTMCPLGCHYDGEKHLCFEKVSVVYLFYQKLTVYWLCTCTVLKLLVFPLIVIAMLMCGHSVLSLMRSLTTLSQCCCNWPVCYK